MNRTILTAILFVSLFAVACGGRNSQAGNAAGLEVTAYAASERVGQTTLEIELIDADGSPIDDAAIAVKGDMTHAGMQPVLADGATFENGVYSLPFEWTMAGDWFLTLDITLADGTMVTERIDGYEITE
ncbi:MAG: FixH family protein [Chloroflexota bacterium]